MSADEERAALIAGWHKLGDAMERDKRILPIFNGIERDYALTINSVNEITDASVLADVVRSLGGTEWQRRTTRSTDGATTYLRVTGRIDGLWVSITADADKVCEPIDPQPVIERRCPQLDAVIAEARGGGDQ